MQRLVYAISRFIFYVLLKIICKIEIKGRSNFPKKAPFIIASNHASNIDPAIVGAACNTASIIFMAKKELFSHPIFGWWFKAIGCIPIDRYSKDFRPLKVAVERLRKKAVLGIFPEGTRSPDGRLQKAELGIGLLAVKTGVPVVPVYISGSIKVLPKTATKLKSHKVKVRVGKPVDLTENISFKEKRKVYECIGEKIMQAISRLKDEEER